MNELTTLAGLAGAFSLLPLPEGRCRECAAATKNAGSIGRPMMDGRTPSEARDYSNACAHVQDAVANRLVHHHGVFALVWCKYAPIKRLGAAAAGLRS